MGRDATKKMDPADVVDPGTLAALIERIGHLEAGLRQELATQVERAERAEAALATAQAREATVAISTQTKVATPTAHASALEATPGAERMLSFARQEAARIIAEARLEADAIQARAGTEVAVREALVRVRGHIMERQALVSEVMSVARQAIDRLSDPTRWDSQQRSDDGGQDEH